MDALEEIEAPAIGRTSLDLLQAIYRCADQPFSIRMKAAMAALPYEHPKLAVTVALEGAEGWASQLQRCIARSRPVLELHRAEPIGSAHPTPQEVSAAASRRPLVSYRR
jgi:hypothetical protein